MPPPSSWKTPLRLAALQQREGLCVVERELVRIDRLAARSARSASTALSRIVRLRRPRKSILSRPAFSTSPIVPLVVTTSFSLSLFGSFCSGTYS